jgi:hypothetical protein
MDYASAENQIVQVEQQGRTTLQKMQTLAQKLRSSATDETTGREQAMDLREIALAVQQQNQSVVTLVDQMAEYIKTLEGQLQSHPNPTVQPRGWGNRSPMSGGGFWGSITSGLGMGAGFAVADDVVGGLFNML